MAKLFGAAAEFLARKFGGSIALSTSNPTIGTTQQVLIANDPERLAVVIVNTSLNDLYLNWSPEVSASNGIILGSSGGTISYDVEQDGILPALELNALASGAGSLIFVAEIRRDTREVEE